MFSSADSADPHACPGSCSIPLPLPAHLYMPVSPASSLTFLALHCVARQWTIGQRPCAAVPPRHISSSPVYEPHQPLFLPRARPGCAASPYQSSSRFDRLINPHRRPRPQTTSLFEQTCHSVAFALPETVPSRRISRPRPCLLGALMPRARKRPASAALGPAPPLPGRARTAASRCCRPVHTVPTRGSRP